MSLKVHMESEGIAMLLNSMSSYTLQGDQANKYDHRIVTNYNTSKFVLTGFF